MVKQMSIYENGGIPQAYHTHPRRFQGLVGRPTMNSDMENNVFAENCTVCL
jgi:hypothetical protein